MKRKKYSKEFKLEAVAMLEKRVRSATIIARDLGVRRNQLYKWQRELRVKGKEEAFSGAGRRAPDQVSMLEKRIAVLEEENAILKKAEAYFAKQQE